MEEFLDPSDRLPMVAGRCHGVVPSCPVCLASAVNPPEKPVDFDRDIFLYYQGTAEDVEKRDAL